MRKDNERLVVQAQAGKIAAITKLLKQHYQRMYTTAYAYTHNQADALDVVQEASMRAVLHIGQLQDPTLFSTWLTRIVINESTRLLAKRAKESAVSLDEWLPATTDDPEARLVVHETLGMLSERYATVLQQHYLDGWSVHEIADALNVSDNTIKTRLARGRQAFMTVLKEDV